MSVLVILLLLPAIVTGLVWYLHLIRTRWAVTLFFVALVPPIWMAAVFIALFNGAEMDGAAAVPPIVIAIVQIIGLWTAWYANDPKSAGQALAVAEGAAAAYHVKHDRPVLGAITGAGAVAQWNHSSRLPSAQPRSVGPSPGLIPAGSPLGQALGQLALSHARGELSDEAFELAWDRLLHPPPPDAHTPSPPNRS